MMATARADRFHHVHVPVARFQNGLGRPSFFDYLACAISVITLASSNFWKVQGPVILFAFIIFCISYVVYSAIRRNIFYKNTILFLFSLVGIIYLILSWFDFLPGDPEFFLQDYVFRMGYFVAAIYPITAMFYALFCTLRNNDMFTMFSYVSITGCIVSVVALYLFPPYDGHWLVEGSQISFVDTIYSNVNYTITNITILLLWAVFWIFRNNKALIVMFLLFLLSSASAQMLLLSILVLVIWSVNQPAKVVKPIALLIVFGFPFSAILMVIFGQQLGIDPNTIHRAKWWTEALLAMLANGGIGLGFGADSTTDFIVEDRFQMLGKWGQLPIHVIHNDFVYSFYSMGVIGGVLILLYHFRSLIPSISVDRNINRHLSLIFLTICLTTSVNSAFVSPTIFVGLCFLYGYLQSMSNRILSS